MAVLGDFAYVISSPQQLARYLSSITGDETMTLAKVTDCSRPDVNPDVPALKSVPKHYTLLNAKYIFLR